MPIRPAAAAMTDTEAHVVGVGAVGSCPRVVEIQT
jgi:hypothetical protein